MEKSEDTSKVEQTSVLVPLRFDARPNASFRRNIEKARRIGRSIDRKTASAAKNVFAGGRTF